jgi:hypothetical protein
MPNTKIEQLQKALDLLKDQDVDELRHALELIGEPAMERISVDVTPKGSKVKIVVLQRGWVAVGEYARDGSEVVLTNAATIRVWGTTKGLGELFSGPTSSTKLDKAGTMRIEELTTVLTMDVEDAKWLPKLS